MIGKTSVTIGTYNVKNMFGERDVQRAGGGRTPVKSERSLDALAENIRRADADVVALQECTSRETLDDFMKTRGLSENYKYVAHVPGNDGRGVNVAVISKYPFTEVVSHKDVTFPLADGSGDTKFSRDFLRVDIDVDGKPGADVSLYTTHSKSRRPSAPGQISSDTKRLSEGRAMRDIAETEMKQFPGRLFVLTGDFNDNTDDASVQAVLNPGGGREEWVDSLAGKPDSERNTWPANPKRNNGFAPEQFDHMIFPKSMSNRLVNSQVHRYTQSDSTDTRWVSSTASDHLMITSEFNLRD